MRRKAFSLVLTLSCCLAVTGTLVQAAQARSAQPSGRGLHSLRGNVSAIFRAVSCPRAGDCAAVGEAELSAGQDQAFIETSTGGVWGAGMAAKPGTGTF